MHRAVTRPWAIRGLFAMAVVVAACNSDSGGQASTGPIFPVTPKFEIGVPTAASVIQGATTTLPITIIRTAYPGPVFVTFSGLPAGVTAPGVSSTSTDQLSITITAGASATTGVKEVTVNATGSDAPSRTATFNLTVVAK
ncbi:MAG: hypothetical protein IPK33_03990 [Gemmatimonadetes bacterium]|jgi:hypothetical protein|nr:hypothetical protein [Gemmatimonadota bacterium]MBK8057061.1 hypothetical protein [Gemmatimonadota bacterium]MBK8649175.1 hypothetical protein [Gemmatimonadota bacterium]HNV77042.1 hypothetical protein [Gemmatimonadaceae bacterium]